MPEDKRKINCWIPISLYDKIGSAGDNTTQVIIKALERLFEDPQEDISGYKQDIAGYKQDIAGYKQNIEAFTVENTILKESIIGYKMNIEGSRKDLERIQTDVEKQTQDILGYLHNIKALEDENIKLKDAVGKAPNPIEFAQLRARYEELERHNETLKTELLKAGQDKEDLKTTFNNYFIQVQTLINQKAVEAPGGKKPWWRFW